MTLPRKITFTRVGQGRFTTEYREDIEVGGHPVLDKLLIQNWCLPSNAPYRLTVEVMPESDSDER